ncbi:MAG: hypothetical protein ACOCUA_00190 [archaeon]
MTEETGLPTVNLTFLAIAIVGLALLGGLGWAAITGTGPFPGDSGQSLDDFPTATPTAEPEATTTDGPTQTEVTPFAFNVDDIAECGFTCRDVTATLFNQRSAFAHDVTVYTRVYAGRNVTDPDDMVWEGREDVGDMAPDETDSSTRRVEISLLDAQKIQQRDGWITIVTAVESEEETVTFHDTEQVE